jgi:ERF superfamily
MNGDLVDREEDALVEANLNRETGEIFMSPLRMSKDIGEIASAFCSAQAEFSAAKKDSTLKVLKKDSVNPVYTSKYADLASVIDAALAPLNKHGIAVLQPAQLSGNRITVMTRLQHKSGQFFESDLTMPVVQGFSAQSVGSAITYARRYSLQAMICLAAEDDDGNAASGVGSREAAQAVAKRKLDEYNAKKGTSVAAIFYTWFDESETAEITGSAELLKANEDLLKRYVTSVSGKRAIVVDGDQLESLKHEFELRKIEFRQLKAA